MALPNSYLDKIRHIYLFDNLSDAIFKQVSAHSKLVKFETGDTPYLQGDCCHNFYIVFDGVVKLFHVAPNGTERVLELIGANQLLGEDAMFIGQYSTHAVALQASHLIAFDARSFAQLLQTNAALCMRMMTLMSRRQQILIDEIGSLTLQSAIQRVTQYLIKEKSSPTDCDLVVRFNANKQVIASRLGVTPETFSRIIGKLRNEGMIDCVKDSIVLKNVASLRQVADGMISLSR